MSQADDSLPASVPGLPSTSGAEVVPTNSGLPSREKAVSRRSGRTWILVLACGLLAGLTGFGFGEYALRLFAPSLVLPPAIRNDQILGPLEHARRLSLSQYRVATTSYGVQGALLGLALGAAGGLARRSPGAAIAAALIGLVLGAAAGTATTFLLLRMYYAFHADPSSDNATQELYLALATHGGIWVAVGTAGGLGLGLGLGRGRIARAIIGGIMGAAVAAVIYEIGGAVVFPLDKTVQPTAMAPGPRLLAHLAVAVCVSAGSLWAADHLSLRRESVRAHT
jgi:hypothetical protein